MAAAWGAAPDDAASPTFALLHEYPAARGRIHHLDLYRARRSDEVWSAVYDELEPGAGLLVIEWADRFPELVPPDAIRVRITHAGGDRRNIAIEP